MAEKRTNRFLIIAVVLALACVLLVMCSKKNERYQSIDELPDYDPAVKRQDGDTQADTIKALQAYAKEAVDKAEALQESTDKKLKQVLESQQQVSRLQLENEKATEQLRETTALVDSLEQQLSNVRRDLTQLQRRPTTTELIDDAPLNEDGLPVGFGFDDPLPIDSNQGNWYEPIDQVPVDDDSAGNDQQRFPNLLSPGTSVNQNKIDNSNSAKQPDITIDPVYTIPKDSTLTDAVALTALIGRIPVDGQTPDPYPVKIFVGRENLLANGHELPEVEGMIFSGLGFGDWNLSCVSARLMSATYIFSDGTIVNHSTQGQPLGYISDPAGVPCVGGKFVSNAASFISQRIGLASIGAAGSAYAEAQQQRQTSALTGTTTSTFVGDIDKLVAGEAVQSATDEVSRWLLARQKQSFDAVVVNPGAPVAIHLEQTLALDKNSLARKLRYAKQQGTDRSGLD